MPRREDCRFRAIEELDLERVLAWRNSERIRACMFSDRLISWDEHRAWFERIKHEPSTICQIFEFRHCPVGIVNITQIDKYNNKCFWGFYRGEVNLPHGTGSAMGYLALEFIFENLSLNKVGGEILAFNQISIQFHQKLGFSQEGFFKKHIVKNHQYEDIVFMALLKEQWLESKINLDKVCFSTE